MTTGLLHDFFGDSAQRWPERIALEVPPDGRGRERVRVTYRELADATDHLAPRLEPHIHGECVVGILLPRTNPNLFAAQLAVLQSGAAYTCLDPSFPDERIRDVLADARAVALVTDRIGAARLRDGEREKLAVIEVEGVWCSPSRTPQSAIRNPQSAIAVPPDRLAYLIYTSGTTGRPKGVMIEHRSIVNLVASDRETFRLTPEDRVTQGSSAAYDSSVEETWLAFAVGATLVVMDDEAARLGPDLVEWLRRERVTVFCPPPTLLRATGCRDPEGALPELKLLYVGGEALPADIAERWSRGRTLVNGYGPTECTVTCLRDAIASGEPITIGRPVTGVSAWVLNEARDEAATGARGELWIGGIGLARGYWAQPDITAEKFILHPHFGRLYRTGDLVHRDGNGRFFYHGRLDAQVKLRGYRIELAEVEARLVELPGVRAAACYVLENNGHSALAAVVVPQDPSYPVSGDTLKARLGALLPDYMVPAQIGFRADLPTTIGGKLDRAALARHVAREQPAPSAAPPRTPLETKIHDAMWGVLGGSRAISLHDDFFRDLGGDSLHAAHLVTALRDDPDTAWATVRDVYETRTIASLAARAPADPTPSRANRRHADAGLDGSAIDASPREQTVTGALQAAWIAASLILGAVLTYVAAFHLVPWAATKLGVVALLLLAPPFVLAGVALYTGGAIANAAWLKRRLIGRYEPRRAPVWGRFYLRNWIVQRAVKLVPWWLIEETEFKNDALRALGATIGERVHIHRGVDLLRGGWDGLTIGDDVTISRDVALELVRLEEKQIVIATISLGRGCTLETHAHVGAGATVEANGFLTARSSLARGARVPADARWDGIPAQPAGAAPPAPAIAAESATSPRQHAAWMVLARLLVLAALALPVELAAFGIAWTLGIDIDGASGWMTHPLLDARVLVAGGLLAVVPVALLVWLEALACRLLGRVSPGVISRWSGTYVCVSLKAELVNAGSTWLYGTLFWPAWLRLAGMKVGRGCEISSLIDTVPELVEIGDWTFCADGIYLAVPRIHRGTVTLGRVRFGTHSFVGNGAILYGGLDLPDHILLGVCTVADTSYIRTGTSWFGHPPFELARPAVHVDRRLTHEPSTRRYAVRVSWEAARFILPAAYGAIIPAWYAALSFAETKLSTAALVLLAVPVINLAAILAPALLAVVIKWTFLGRVRPGTYPLWSAWASRWDYNCLSWYLYVAQTAALLEGTPWLAWLLRAAGVRVGRGVVLGNGFAENLPDPDMLTLEDGATVDGQFQAHTFEDRMLKTDRVLIGRNATISRNAVLLYGACVGAETYVAPNSVVMKHEHLLPGRRYEGAPTRSA